MKRYKLLFSSIFCGFALLLADGAVDAGPSETANRPDAKPASNCKRCFDLKADLSLRVAPDGLVTMSGTLTNIGQANCVIPGVAEVIMNLAYAPAYSYMATGVAEVLVSRPFPSLQAGASIPVNASYRIPAYRSPASSGKPANARRMFTLRVRKQDRTPYKPGEDRKTCNNRVSREVNYLDVQHHQAP